MKNNSGHVLYVGGFELPDKNAAAQRVVSVAKALSEIGLTVEFINQTADTPKGLITETSYFGFKCSQIHKDDRLFSLIKRLITIKHIKNVIKKDSSITHVIAYNFPSIALRRLNSFCRKQGIKCVGDITEWYVSNDRFFPLRLVKNIDSNYRMKTVNKSLDGLIVISDYLYEYYRRKLPLVNVPPLVDKNDSKWTHSGEGEHEGVEIVYAGSPSKTKERLDIIVNSIKPLSHIRLRIIGISRDQYNQIYSQKEPESNDLLFEGRVSHLEAIEFVKKADYSILMRDDNLVNKAGFPTKFVESISAGTPVLTNDNSCLKKYIKDGRNGILVDENNLESELTLLSKSPSNIVVEDDIFDYHCYVDRISSFLNELQ